MAVRRTSCSACDNDDLRLFLNLGTSPVADAYTLTPDEESPRYPLQVAVCSECGLVQLLDVLPTDVLFGTGYSFYSSASAPLSAYHKEYAKDVLVTHSEQVERGVIEIGCNDGDMLRHFQHLPHIGVDPSAGPVAVARERDCNVIEDSFSLSLAKRIKDKRGVFGVVIANHVLAHVEDVSDFLAGVAHLMDDDSVAMVEVQYLPDLLVNNAFDLVYHEHRNFFSLTSLKIAGWRHNLYVVDAKFTDRQGGSIRVAFRKKFFAHRTLSLLQTERWLDSFSAYDGMQGRAERIRERLRDTILGSPRRTAVYGAPAKATTLLNFCDLTVDELPWCVDTTKAKQGRHIPGTGIPIIAPEREETRPDMYLLAAWNYASSIVKNNPGNRWLIPFPAPVTF